MARDKWQIASHLPDRTQAAGWEGASNINLMTMMLCTKIDSMDHRMDAARTAASRIIKLDSNFHR
jgi:hypothetical protein